MGERKVINLDSSDSELDDPEVFLDVLRDSLNSDPAEKARRRVAGNRRASNYRTTQGYRGRSGCATDGPKLYQSITMTPAFKDTSFEELRVECYFQSLIATGKAPRQVDTVRTPWAVIPPMFNALKVANGMEDCGADVLMRDS